MMLQSQLKFSNHGIRLSSIGLVTCVRTRSQVNNYDSVVIQSSIWSRALIVWVSLPSYHLLGNNCVLPLSRSCCWLDECVSIIIIKKESLVSFWNSGVLQS